MNGREIALPAAELTNDGVIIKSLSSATLRDGVIAGTFSLGMGGFTYVCVGTSVKESRLLRAFARRVVPVAEWMATEEKQPLGASFFFEERDKSTDATDLAGLLVTIDGDESGLGYVLGTEIIIIPSTASRPIGAPPIAHSGDPTGAVKTKPPREVWAAKQESLF